MRLKLVERLTRSSTLLQICSACPFSVMLDKAKSRIRFNRSRSRSSWSMYSRTHAFRRLVTLQG